MKFSTDDLFDYICGPVIDNRMGERRWSEMHEIVFQADDEKLYLVHWDQGLTEYQEHDWPDADRDGFVECPEVEVYEEMIPVKKWRKV